MTQRPYIPVVLFLTSFFILLYSAYPTIGWWNSGFFVACADNLGLPGPGDSIFYVLLGRTAIVMLPFLSVATAVTIVSIASASLAAVCLYFILTTIFVHLKEDDGDGIAHLAAFFTALTLPFLHSIWTEAIVSRTYSLGLLLNAIILLCSVKIWLSSDESEKIRLFFILVFTLGIDFAAHRLSSPLIPVAILLMLFPLRQQLSDLRFWLVSIALYFGAAFLLHLYLPIRGNLYPAVDLADVQTLEQMIAWIKMERYGESNFLNIFNRKAPFWEYQFKDMYLRYFTWNFSGGASSQEFFDVKHLSRFPMLFGIIGFVFGLRRHIRSWILIFITFLCGSILLAYYFNVADGFHHIREIDRLYLLSFMVFSIWIGIGLLAVFRMMNKYFQNTGVTGNAALVMLTLWGAVLLPLNVIYSNWWECSRRNYTFPTDFAKNLLNTCEENAILFTNGDNDTFPLWYLQQVERYRTDVSVLNLPLTNLPFYIRQIVTGESAVRLDSSIVNKPYLKALKLESPKVAHLPPPSTAVDGFTTTDSIAINLVGRNFGNGNILIPQDRVLLSIIENNRWQRPLYFAITVAGSNKLGLNDYLATAGVAQKLLPVSGIDLLPGVLDHNLRQVYEYRHVDDRGIKMDESVISLYQNYRYLFISLADVYLQQGNIEDAKAVFEKMNAALPPWRFQDMEDGYVADFAEKLRRQME